MCTRIKVQDLCPDLQQFVNEVCSSHDTVNKPVYSKYAVRCAICDYLYNTEYYHMCPRCNPPTVNPV